VICYTGQEQIVFQCGFHYRLRVKVNTNNSSLCPGFPLHAIFQTRSCTVRQFLLLPEELRTLKLQLQCADGFICNYHRYFHSSHTVYQCTYSADLHFRITGFWTLSIVRLQVMGGDTYCVGSLGKR
jgi:hypothetical protein